MSNISREIILKELQLELCRRDFYEFCKYIDPVFFTKAKKHLKQIAEAFQKVADGRIKKLAISMPPRAGKSYITSLFCAWMLGRNPLGSIMRNSYAAKLAEKFSKDIRDGILTNPKYLEIFQGTKVSRTSSSIDGWSLEGNVQPSYFCAGVGGAITGLGCTMVAILDDPIKNIEEAMSETVIENTWNWYTSTHLSRLEKGCAEIHIATRWSRKDPIGRLTDEYAETYNADFTVINISALDEHGQSFCDEIKTTEEYLAIRKVTDEFIWEAEFMQRPIESKGLLFPVEELKRFTLDEIRTKKPDGVIGFCDTADSGKDFLSGPIGKRFDKDTYITDVVFTQDGVEITEPLVAEMIIDTGCELFKIESNNGGHSYARNIRKLIQGKSPCAVVDEMNMKNKETRILMNAGYIKEYFYFRSDYEPGSDYDKFMRYLTSYIKLGKNKHDDAPDSITGLAEYMKLINYTAPEQKKKKDWFFDNEEKEEDYLIW
ncbi:MAG: phage terminase large subunit [Bacillota bacterium]|nr:phage terminase large subunit [Bacillota bacterium]